MSSPTVFQVRGMTCGGCAKRIRTAIEADLGEDTTVTVDHRSGRVSVASAQDVAPEAVRSAVERAGYEFAGTAA